LNEGHRINPSRKKYDSCTADATCGAQKTPKIFCSAQKRSVQSWTRCSENTENFLDKALPKQR